MTSVNNIERLRLDRGWSRPQLGKRMGTSGQQIERLEKGQRTLKQEWIDKAATALGVTPSDIITPLPAGYALSGQTEVLPADDPNEIVQIQRLDLSLSMGPGTVIDDYVEAEPVSFDLAFIRRITRSPAHRLKLVTGIGDSMYPTLNWGDAILIDTTDRALAKQDGIYWIDLFGAAGLKRLRTIAAGRVLVISDNPTVGDQEVAAEDLRIEGRAIWVARGL
ncbi:helix-turn-helix transcriptional regulator [Croceibacterium xixiisoli]|uniref:LexA family transcriptional regulator n=1 Tax=Croceibacterium xixiisoli TaxID=1476466 RepID=UPI00136DA4B4|nr:S24 family peptidase [Croceibacterium xixiisoli]